jgi:hypothetical protein
MNTDDKPPQGTPHADPGLEAKLAALNTQAVAELEKRESARLSSPSGDRAEQPQRKKLNVNARIALWVGLKTVAVVVLPFFVLIRLGVLFYQRFDVPTWPALAGSAALTAILLTFYGAKISKLLTGKRRFGLIAKRLALPIIVFYCGYGLLFLSSVNAKSETVRDYYSSVHPLLRLSLSTAILADREIVVTDAKREPEDYARMGLPLLENSLHFRQDGGYVHAVDLRTIGRAEWKNALLVGYFRVMGFRTLRHVGTADHLHVSLAPRGDPRL